MKKNIKIFPTPEILAERFAVEIADMIRKAEKSRPLFTIALSGGNTPKLLFSEIAERHRDSVNWRNVHFFWVDERCVPPGNSESNYGEAARLLFSRIEIPLENIHRIKGEEEPDKEMERYSREIMEHVRVINSYPAFDLIILGMGDDGHTASIFPGSLHLLKSAEICEKAFHPVTSQIRITLTGKVINNAESVVFMVTGKNKSSHLREIFGNGVAAVNFPASYINPTHGKITWFLDEEAGCLIE